MIRAGSKPASRTSVPSALRIFLRAGFDLTLLSLRIHSDFAKSHADIAIYFPEPHGPVVNLWAGNMSDSHVYKDVTQSIFECVKRRSEQEHGTKYNTNNGNDGTATTKVPFVGDIVMAFNFDQPSSKLTYTLQSKPALVTESAIWSGIESTIGTCMRG